MFKKRIDEGYEVGYGLGRFRGTDDETVPSVRMRGNMWNNCMGSGGDEILGGGLGTSFVSTHVIKLGVRKGSVCGTMVGQSGVEMGVEVIA